VDVYIKEREKLEKSGSLTKEKELSELRSEAVRNIKIHLLGKLSTIVKLTAAVEQGTKK